MSVISSCVSKFSFLWVWKCSCRHCPDSKVPSGYLHTFICLIELHYTANFNNTCCHSSLAATPFSSHLCLETPCIPFCSHLCPGKFAQVCFEDVLWEKGVLPKQKNRKKGRIQSNTTTHMVPIQTNLKSKQSNKQTKPKSIQDHNNQKKPTKQKQGKKCLL